MSYSNDCNLYHLTEKSSTSLHESKINLQGKDVLDVVVVLVVLDVAVVLVVLVVLDVVVMLDVVVVLVVLDVVAVSVATDVIVVLVVVDIVSAEDDLRTIINGIATPIPSKTTRNSPTKNDDSSVFFVTGN
jgi:hypothetical protein